MSQKVFVVKYEECWNEEFRRESKEIKRILGENCIAVHHIGSTSVPGLQAKPIIDIMPVVRNIAEVDTLNSDFESIGYECMGEFGMPGRRYFRKGGDERTHQIHIFEESNQFDIQRHLALRDYLRSNAEEARRYGELKASLAKRFPRDIAGYCDGKQQYVHSLEERALAWARARINFILEKPSLRFAQNLAQYADNPKIAANLRDTFPCPYTLRDAEKFLNFCTEEEGKSQMMRVIIVEGKAAGCITLTFGSDVSRLCGELGYWLGEPFWGKGIVTAAVKQILREAFDKTPLLRIIAVPYDYNISSRRVLEKVGFSLECIMKKSVIKNGKVLDSCLYARIKECENE